VLVLGERRRSVEEGSEYRHGSGSGGCGAGLVAGGEKMPRCCWVLLVRGGGKGEANFFWLWSFFVFFVFFFVEKMGMGIDGFWE